MDFEFVELDVHTAYLIRQFYQAKGTDRDCEIRTGCTVGRRTEVDRHVGITSLS